MEANPVHVNAFPCNQCSHSSKTLKAAKSHAYLHREFDYMCHESDCWYVFDTVSEHDIHYSKHISSPSIHMTNQIGRKSLLLNRTRDQSKVVDEEWGFDLTRVTTSDSTTITYIEFLLATLYGKIDGEKHLGKIATPVEKTKIAAYTLGSMTSCMRLYTFLGKEIKALMDPSESSHLYSEIFEASALQAEGLLDTLSVSLTGEGLEVIETLYHLAKMEIDFFPAQSMLQRSIIPLNEVLGSLEQRLILFSDFDLTCTVVDSSAILAEIAIITALKLDTGSQEFVLSRKASVDLRNNWNFLSKQYTEEYEQCIERTLPSAKGTSMIVITEGPQVPLGLFQKIVKNNEVTASVHVLSYCWCGDLTRSAFLSEGLSHLNIHSNEFAYEESISTGEILKKVDLSWTNFKLSSTCTVT